MLIILLLNYFWKEIITKLSIFTIMQVKFKHNNISFEADLSKPLDISIPIKHGKENPNCFWAPYPWFEPYKAGGFVGSTKSGAPVNFYNIKMNPHGNGTHTECVGHIAKEKYSINDCLQKFWFVAELISVTPTKQDNGDEVISLAGVQNALVNKRKYEALIIRTLPNAEDKKTKVYSSSNPCYLDVAAMEWIVEQGVQHLLIDLPSVDREEDEGKLLSHHAFWNYPAYGTNATADDLAKVRANNTISELIYVPDEIKDETYLLNIQIASFDLDVSPSKIVLYKIES